jgi:hypothetical protein
LKTGILYCNCNCMIISNLVLGKKGVWFTEID